MSNFNQYLPKKSFEISYALFRVAELLKHSNTNLAHHLEASALDLLSAGASLDIGTSARSLNVVEHLLMLGSDTGFINRSNSEVIIREVRQLNAAIAGFDNAATLPDSEISDIFSGAPVDKESHALGSDRKEKSNVVEKQKAERKKLSDLIDFSENEEDLIENPTNTANVQNPAIIAELPDTAYGNQLRQSMVLDKIRENGECGLRELKELFPNISERTLRYDLHRLIEDGMIERVGTSGPATYYQARSSL